MANNQATMSYPCVVSTVMNMDAGLRAKLADRLGTFLKTEKVIPLKLNQLEVEASKIKTDDTEYHIGVVRFDQDNGKPRPMMRDGKLDKLFYNVDRYGVKILSEKSFQTVERLERDDKNSLEILTETVNEMIRRRDENPDEFDEAPILEECQKEMLRLSKDFVKYELKRRNVEPDYKYFLHLSIKRGDEEKTEIVEYNQNLREAQEYMMEKILGERCQINVNLLKILEPERAVDPTLDPPMLPHDTKLKVKNLDLAPSWGPLELLRPLLAPSCLPLESIRTIGLKSEDHEFLTRDVQKKVIKFGNGLHMLSYKRIHFERSSYHPGETSWALQQLLELANAWRNSKREVGTHYSFDRNEDEYFNWMKVFRSQPGAVRGEVTDPRTNIKKACVILPIDEETEINIFGSYIPAAERTHRNDDYLLEFIVQPQGHATPL